MLNDVYNLLRLINIALGVLIGIVIVLKMALIEYRWYLIKHKKTTALIEPLDIMEMLMWTVLLVWDMSLILAGAYHALAGSITGIFIPFATLALLLTCLLILYIHKLDMNQKEKLYHAKRNKPGGDQSS